MLLCLQEDMFARIAYCLVFLWEPAHSTPAQHFGYIPTRPTVVIDPGHGGMDSGHFYGESVEKNITLALACALTRRLQKNQLCNIVLTRTGDASVDTTTRLNSALRHYPTCYISLHASYHDNPNIRGALVYHAGTEHRKKAHFSHPEIVLARSELLADTITHHLKNSVLVLQEDANCIPSKVMALLPCASVYISVGYISNPQESRILQNPAYTKALAHILGDAIEDYLAQLERATF